MTDNLVQLSKKGDPIRRNVEKDVEDEGLSPMSPPDAYAPPGSDQAVPYEDMHPLLQSLRDEHDAFVKDLKAFEDALGTIAQHGISRELGSAMSTFFRSVDENLIPHNKREEKELLPLLKKRLIEKGERSNGPNPTTASDVLEDDHIEMVQLSAIVFNFFGLASRLPDKNSQLLTFDTAIEQAKNLVELIRLHIFREDNVVFSLAHKYISTEEFDVMVKNEADAKAADAKAAVAE